MKALGAVGLGVSASFWNATRSPQKPGRIQRTLLPSCFPSDTGCEERGAAEAETLPEAISPLSEGAGMVTSRRKTKLWPEGANWNLVLVREQNWKIKGPVPGEETETLLS